ncbi:cytochrome P450 [Aspergillus avenaceus]|uniref:Cytochrome P450 n=1 Tax=Aspergillus avenaceus TaxID=36643 RepID=A0A5N6U6V0_ASPAV|nr:cytochrome P450 [Aspergillus avenaceus]
MNHYRNILQASFIIWLFCFWFVSRHVALEPHWLFALALASCLGLFVAHIVLKTFIRRRSSVLKDLPGPKSPSWLCGHALNIFDEPLAFNVTEWINARPYPDGLMHFYGLLGSEYIVPTNGEGLVEVLSTRAYDFEKTNAFRRYAIRFFGDGLVSAEQELHKRDRKTYLPIYNKSAVTKMQPMLTSKSKQFVDRILDLCHSNQGGLKGGTTVIPIAEMTGRISLDIISITAFGIDFETILGKNHDIFEAYEMIFASTYHKRSRFMWHNIAPPWLINMIPSSVERRMDAAHDMLTNFLRQVAVQKKSEVEKGSPDADDYLTNYIKQRPNDIEAVIPQIITILSAGYESTGGTLAWVIYCLAIHPEAQAALRQELATAKGSQVTLPELDYDNLPVLNAIVMEATRLYPSFSLLLRKAIRDTSINGRFVPRGTYIGLCPRAINYAHHLWGYDAEEFKIERWIDYSDPAHPVPSALGGAPSTACMLSFFYGARSCVGRGLALAQMKRQIALIAEQFQVERVDDWVPLPSGLIASTPPLDLKLKFTSIS